jgi:hypothetical protein
VAVDSKEDRLVLDRVVLVRPLLLDAQVQIAFLQLQIKGRMEPHLILPEIIIIGIIIMATDITVRTGDGDIGIDRTGYGDIITDHGIIPQFM